MTKWIQQLRDLDADRRAEAVTRLGLMGARAAAATPNLLRVLKEDPERYVRSFAASSLGAVAAGNPEVVQTLVRRLRSTDPFTRHAAAGALGLMGPKGRGGLSGLRQLFASSDRDDRFAAAEALSAIAPEDEQATGVLLEELLDCHSIEILTPLGPALKSFLTPVVTGRLTGKEAATILRCWVTVEQERSDALHRRANAAEALVNARTRPGLSILMRIVEDENVDPELRATIRHQLALARILPFSTDYGWGSRGRR